MFNNSTKTNTKNKQSKRKIIVTITVAILVLVSIVLYNLAYRYLIERAETPVKNSSNQGLTTVKNTEINNDLSSNNDSSNNTETSSNTNENKDTKNNTSTKAESDDWNYKSDNVEISIEKITKGTGTDKITYFIADVKTKDSSYIQSAFAKDTFGRNIVDTTSNIAEENNAIFAINGDYYGFRGDGVLIRNSTIYRDTPTRISAAFYKDGTMEAFDETKTTSEELLSSGVTNTFSFGPVLINDGKVSGDFDSVMVDTNFGNRSIQAANPRTAVGMVEPNHYIFVVVDGRKENYSRGMTLTELAELMDELGCKEAYNLDGGGSSTMYFMGRVVNDPLGKSTERKISDILYIKE